MFHPSTTYPTNGSMRTNGYLMSITLQGSTRNEDGERTKPTEVLGDKVECLIKTITHNNRGKYEDGKFKNSSYEILIEDQPFDATRIQLFRWGKPVGAFEVQDIQPIDS